MKLKNLSIRTQLIIGFSAMLFLVMVLGVISYFQSVQIHLQTETMYNHPLKTRRALEEIKSSVLSMRVNIRDFLLVENAESRQQILDEMAVNESNVALKVDNLRQCYLGPPADIDTFTKEFAKWVSMCEETIRIHRTGSIEEARLRHEPGGIAPVQALKVLAALQQISDFATDKGDDLYNKSIELKESLNQQLIILIFVILLLSMIIVYVLLRNIRKPMDTLTNATQRFHSGDMNARSSYQSNNEFGILSDSFNNLAESIQMKTDRDEKFASLSGLMLSEYDVKKFFQSTLKALSLYTNSQMAAIYLLSDDEKTFNHFESLGVDDNARQSFAADRFEGEFGAALASRQVQHLKNIPEDTRFVFYTVSGKFIPHEIITIPVIANNNVVAIISLATVSTYNKASIQLIDNILATLCARIEGILAYHKINGFLLKLEHQNHELLAQKTELASQSAELLEQNTELEMQKKQLGEASQLKTNFLSNMSHELRTPLNSVIALTGVLNRRLAKLIPEEEYSYLEVIERNGKHLLRLINDILDISRIEAGREDIENTAFDMNGLVAELVNMIQPQAQQKSIQLVHTNREAGIPVTSDKAKCRHILQNLIGNAVKFTDKGKVSVSVTKSNDTVIISVTDTGIGISESNQLHIFDEFRQADGSTSRRFGGTGLGLAIAKKYAFLLGGKITVHSKSGEGSEFTLILPLRYIGTNEKTESEPYAVLQHSKQKPPNFPSALSGKTILLVEDSEPAIIQIKDILEASGYHLLIARNGEEALGIIAHTIPDAMLLDLMMPGIDGFEVLKNLREAEQTANIPVLILTAKHITKEELQFLTRNNIHELIQKGDVNRNDLLNAVTTMILPKIEELKKPHQKQTFPAGKPRVLVVEDNPDNMVTVTALLADNYSVIEAVNGHQAVEHAQKHHPDLILMDIALPGIDGIQAFKTIRTYEKLKDIPIIALTASEIGRAHV